MSHPTELVKQPFADTKARALLEKALAPETPTGTAAAIGAILILLLREQGVKAEYLENF